MLFSFRSLKLSRSLVVADGVHVLVRAVLLCDFAPGRVRGVWFTRSHPGKSILRVNASAVIEKGMNAVRDNTACNETSRNRLRFRYLGQRSPGHGFRFYYRKKKKKKTRLLRQCMRCMWYIYVGRWCKRAALSPAIQSSSARPSGNEAR